MAEVRRVDNDQRPVLALHVREGRSMKDFFLIVLNRILGTPGPLEPVKGVEQTSDQVTLYITPQKDFLEIIKCIVPMQTVIGGRETAARNRTDEVDLIQHALSATASVATANVDFRIAQLQHHAIGQCGSPRAAT